MTTLEFITALFYEVDEQMHPFPNIPRPASGPVPTNGLIAYAVRDRFGGGQVFRTIDGGQSWTDISGDLPDPPMYTIAVDPGVIPNVLYVGSDSSVYASTDLGTHWVRFGTALPNGQVIDLKLNPALNILAAGTHGRGVWKIPLD